VGGLGAVAVQPVAAMAANEIRMMGLIVRLLVRYI
jgi:hypothetical protein